MRIVWPKTEGVNIRGKQFTQSDLVKIRKLIRSNPSWGRTRLSEEVCQHFEWRQENGRLKDRGCRVALLKLEALGYLKLPPKKNNAGGKPPHCYSVFEQPEDNVTKMPLKISLELVNSRQQSQIWNSLIAQYHYLGLATPVGKLIRYIISSDETVLGAISFSEAAWSITGRDNLLRKFGLEKNEIRSKVISNNRFLILPHVTVKNLASRVLSLSTKQVLQDWIMKYCMRPIFIETFVDPSRFKGTCYKAANWSIIGTTKGFSKKGASHRQQKSPKLLFLFGTDYSSRKFLRYQYDRDQLRAS